jgi:hypothetical protein
MIKTLLTLLLLVSGLSGQTFGTYKVASVLASGSTMTLTGVTVASGSAIWLFFGTNDQCQSSTFNISDGGGNSYTMIGAMNSRTYSCGVQFYAKNATGFTGNIVVDPSHPWGGAVLAYVEIQGADPTAPLVSSAQGASDASPATTSAITATGSELILSGTINYYTGGTYTANNSFTAPASNSATGSTGAGGIIYRAVTAGSYTPSFGVTGTVYTSNVSASFKAGSAPATVRKRVTVSQ